MSLDGLVLLGSIGNIRLTDISDSDIFCLMALDSDRQTTVTIAPEQAELMVLAMLHDGPAYGYAISKAVATRSGGSLTLGPGKLYPLLSKLEAHGLVSTAWEDVKSPGSDPEARGRRRKWYSLSEKGRRRLRQRIEAHRRLTAIIDRFIPAHPGDIGAAPPAGGAR